MAEALRAEFGDKTILELRGLQEKGHLNLEPGFQRQSVWNDADRRKLIQSVLEGYPVPSIFLYRRDENGWPVYDVIDGKQRLETIFMYTRAKGFMKSGFAVPFRFPDDDRKYWYDWSDLHKWELASAVLTYKLQTVEVSGDLADIVDLFVRINSTGKALTSSEKRHARFFTKPLLRLAERLTRRTRKYFAAQHVARAAQVSRMKDVELVCELLISIANDGPIDAKASVDRAVGNDNLNAKTTKRAASQFRGTVANLRRLFPELRSTRFKNMAEFYSLFMVIWELQFKQRMVVSGSQRLRTAEALLRRLSNGVDEVREQQRSAAGIKPGQELYRDYLLSTLQSTDKLP